MPMNDFVLGWELLEDCSGHEAGRQLLCRLYTGQTGLPCPEIGLSPAGKPYFLNSQWHFSISHTQRHVFCALSRRPVGIDAEETNRQVNGRLADCWLSETERAHYDRQEDQNAALVRLWVLKEALAKQTGRGIGNWLKNTNFDPADSRIMEIDGCFVAVIQE